MNSYNINYTEINPNSPNTIVFLHSEYLSSWVWKNQKDYFDNSKKTLNNTNTSNNNNNNNTNINISTNNSANDNCSNNNNNNNAVDNDIDNTIDSTTDNTKDNTTDNTIDNSYNCVFIDLPEHGNNVFSEEFSISKSGDIIINFLEDFINNKIETNKKRNSCVNIVAMGLGGQIALEILAKSPDLINKIMISGVYLSSNKRNKELTNIIQNTAIINYLNLKKQDDFLIKAYLRHYNISKTYFEDLKYSNSKINEDSLFNIMSEINNFKIPININTKIKNTQSEENNNNNNNTNTNNNGNNSNNINNDNHANVHNTNTHNISIYFGLKESENILKSAFRIDNCVNINNFCAIKKAVHLWNITHSELFNKIIEYEFNNINNTNNINNVNNVNNENGNANNTTNTVNTANNNGIRTNTEFKKHIECFNK
ncbi:MAG: hypothetical protein ACRC1M_08010 [Methanobacteriaceae archaeon]